MSFELDFIASHMELVQLDSSVSHSILSDEDTFNPRMIHWLTRCTTHFYGQQTASSQIQKKLEDILPLENLLLRVH
jgi:hypothetical protein